MESRLRPADSEGGARPRYHTPPTPKPPLTIRTSHASARPGRGVACTARLWRATRTGTMCLAGSAAFTHARDMHVCRHVCVQTRRHVLVMHPSAYAYHMCTRYIHILDASVFCLLDVLYECRCHSHAISNGMSDEHIMCMKDTYQRVRHMLCT